MTTQPTAESPGVGAISAFGVTLTEALHWVEHGCHVLDSTEFQVVVHAETFDEALEKLGDGVLSYAIYLAGLEDRAENENEMLAVLTPRVMEFAKRLDKAEREAEQHAMKNALRHALSRKARHNRREWVLNAEPSGSLPALVV
ncbi:MAG: hypothetical protein AAGC46_16170 [Solirubrobacteraceae bacterium]|nr:hypothetical protein [Patulibacter sp.]